MNKDTKTADLDQVVDKMAEDTEKAAASAPSSAPSETPKRSSGPSSRTSNRRSTGGGGRGGRGGMRAHDRPRPMNRHGGEDKKNGGIIPPLEAGHIRIIPLGGVEEIGKNMTVVEIGNDIIVIDAGLQFKEEDTPGIDYILPNTKYLEERKDRVRAIIITHAHLDHIGAIPFIMDRIGNPPMYTRNLSALMIKKRQVEFPHLQPIDFKVVENSDRIRIGDLTVRFFGVTHSIPDSMGVIIETPYGHIVTPGDYKLEHTDGIPSDREEKEFKIFDTEKTLLLLTDSTNIENPGFSTPEAQVIENLEEIIKNSKNRLIMTMFASHIYRMAAIVKACEKFGKKLVVEGRSMKNNIEITIFAGLINVGKDVMIKPEDMGNYPPDKIVMLVTGAQGDEFSFLPRLINDNYKHFKLSSKDTVLLSSSIVPGNEKAVQKLKDGIARKGAHIMHYRTSEVYIHSTGHGNRGEIEWLHKKTKPKFFIPIHGSHYMLKLHAELAESLGMKKENIIVPDDGMIIEIREGGEKIIALKEKAPSSTVMVDGFTVGDIQEVVIRDRQILAQDGIFVFVAMIDAKTGRLKKSPDIISRGSVYLRESQDLLRESRFLIKRTIERNINVANPINFDHVKNIVADEMARFLFQQTAKRPIVIPVLLSV
jgi:ribonuclease J